MSTRSLGSLTLDLIAKVGRFDEGMSQAQRIAQRRSREIQRSLAPIRGLIASAVGGISFAAVINETVKFEQQMAQLDAALKSTAGAAGLTKDELINLARDFGKETTHSTNEILEAETRLLSYSSILKNEFPRALQATLDQSVRLGISVAQSAEIIGRAIETPSRGMASLSQQGFRFSEEQKRLARELEASGRLAEAQAMVLDVLEESYGGAAKAARDTLGGALSALKGSIEELLAVDGGLPQLTNQVNQLANALQDPRVKESVDSITSFGVEGLSEFIDLVDAAVRLPETLSGSATEIERLQDSIREMDRAINNSWMGKPLKYLFTNTEELKAMRAEAVAMLEELKKQAEVKVSVNVETGKAPEQIEPPPSEDFLKLEAQLKKQVELYGEVSKAAAIAYQIQSGELESLSSKEKKRVLELAKQYDALVEAARAEKDLEQARKSADRELENMLSNLSQQVATYGKSESAVIAWRIAEGDLAETLKNASPELRARVDEIVRLSEAYEAMKESTERLSDLQNQAGQVFEATRTPLERFNAEIERLNTLRDTFVDGEPLIDADTYKRAVMQAQDVFDEQTQKVSEFAMQASRNVQDIIANGLKTGFEDGAKGILRSFGDMLIDMAAQALAADIAGKIFGTSVGSGGGALGNLFGGARASGGPVSAGKAYLVGENGPEIFAPGASGAIIPNHAIGSAPVINIINNASDTRVTTRPGTNGASIDVLIDAAVSKHISSFGSQSNQAIGNTFGARRRLTSR